jgi:hypothetical protein
VGFVDARVRAVRHARVVVPGRQRGAAERADRAHRRLHEHHLGPVHGQPAVNLRDRAVARAPDAREHQQRPFVRKVLVDRLGPAHPHRPERRAARRHALGQRLEAPLGCGAVEAKVPLVHHVRVHPAEACPAPPPRSPAARQLAGRLWRARRPARARAEADERAPAWIKSSSSHLKTTAPSWVSSRRSLRPASNTTCTVRSRHRYHPIRPVARRSIGKSSRHASSCPRRNTCSAPRAPPQPLYNLDAPRAQHPAQRPRAAGTAPAGWRRAGGRAGGRAAPGCGQRRSGGARRS